MKFLDKLGLAIFSILTLILSILMCLIAFGWVEPSVITILITSCLDTQNGMYITIGVSIVLILLAIKCLFFPSYERKRQGDEAGILLQNDSGKLLITIGTIKNLVVGAVNEFRDVDGCEVDVEIDNHNEVNVNLEINVNKETIIKDISSKLQNRIKESVKKATDLDIKQINIKVNDVQKENNYNEEYNNARKIEKKEKEVEKEKEEKISKTEKRTEEKVKKNGSNAE